jgi:hypothetical protein
MASTATNVCEFTLTIDSYLAVFSHLFDRNIAKFPGALPVSLSHCHLNTIHQHEYVVTPKADGQRVFVLFDSFPTFHNVNASHHPKAIFSILYRDMTMHAFSWTNDLDDQSPYTTPRVSNRTDGVSSSLFLFDAELLEDGRLLLFDVLVFNGRSTCESDVRVRFELCRKFMACSPQVQSPFKCEKKITMFPSNVTTHDPSQHCYIPNLSIIQSFSKRTAKPPPTLKYFLSAKPFFLTSDTQRLWAQRKELFSYQVDGLVFVKLRETYRPFRSSMTNFLKWKPEITIDFLILRRCAGDILSDVRDLPCDSSDFKCRYDGPSMSLALLTTPLSSTNAVIFSFADMGNRPSSIIQQIWECALYPGIGWVLQRHRADKTNPNQIRTVVSTMQDIADPVLITDF